MGVVVLGFAGVAALVALLLAVPVDVAFRVRGIEDFRAQATLGWLFGLIRFRLPRPGPEEAKRTARPAAKASTKPAPQARQRRDGAGIVAVLGQAPFRRRLARLARDLAHAAHAREFGLQLRLGTGDPADTGRLWAIVGPIGAVAAARRNVLVRIEPDFVEPCLEFDCHGRLRLIPLQFVALAIGFALSPSSIRAWRTMRAGRA